MATRTVRLDEESEAFLVEIQRETGLSISAVMKRGLATLRRDLANEGFVRPWDIFMAIDHGAKDETLPIDESRRSLRESLRRKHGL